MLAKAKPRSSDVDAAALRQNARLLESVLAEFGVKGQIDQIRPGPVVTMYELVPAPGVKTARVVALADDIARSMSVISCRVAVAQGRNAIGIEMPNSRRETVYLRDLLSSNDYDKASHDPAHGLGRNHRRRALYRRPGQDAPPADRRHHRLGQVGRRQRHDPVDPVQAAAREVPLHHDRPEDAGTVGL
jgi:DNA segregation ATPase FtsK/SpoIIIE-like protein